MNANEIYETLSGDCTTRIHHAMRFDGLWFIRYQSKGFRGYTWGCWREGFGMPAHARATGRKARLPK
jgi:hypothetical protein